MNTPIQDARTPSIFRRLAALVTRPDGRELRRWGTVDAAATDAIEMRYPSGTSRKTLGMASASSPNAWR
jgi:hypothetical protein